MPTVIYYIAIHFNIMSPCDVAKLYVLYNCIVRAKYRICVLHMYCKTFMFTQLVVKTLYSAGTHRTQSQHKGVHIFAGRIISV